MKSEFSYEGERAEKQEREREPVWESRRESEGHTQGERANRREVSTAAVWLSAQSDRLQLWI